MKIIRSKRKTLSIQINSDAEVLVRAPNRMSQRRIDLFIKEKEEWINRKVNERKEYLRLHPDATDAELDYKKRIAQELIPPIVEKYAGIMNLTPTAIKINKAKKRYGSCSAKNSLNFSCMLIDYPTPAIEYVVVHELSHIVHKNHGKEFYALIESVLPDYKERRSLLK